MLPAGAWGGGASFRCADVPPEDPSAPPASHLASCTVNVGKAACQLSTISQQPFGCAMPSHRGSRSTVPAAKCSARPDPAAAAGGRVNQAAHRFSPAWATGRQQLVRQHCKLHASSCMALQPHTPGAVPPRAQSNLSSQRAIAGSTGTTAARTAGRTDRSSGGRAVPAAPGAAAAGERSEPLARRARSQRRQPPAEDCRARRGRAG